MRVNGFLTLSNSARFHDDASDWGVLFSHFLSMPNWNYNEVTVFASAIEVRQFFVKQEDHYRFNMNRIFPEQFAANDPTGDDAWDYDWACNHTGTKWFPRVDEVVAVSEGQSGISYDTAWAPNNLILLRISKMTGWKIKNEYSEPGMCFEGTFFCEAGKVLLDEERVYRQCCEQCDARYLTAELPEDALEHYLCPRCYTKQGG